VTRPTYDGGAPRGTKRGCRWFALFIVWSRIMNRTLPLVALLGVLATANCTTYRVIRYREPDARNQDMFPSRLVRKYAKRIGHSGSPAPLRSVRISIRFRFAPPTRRVFRSRDT
jgi:hypothetical protein